MIIAQTLFLGENLLTWLTLAFGGALVAGNGLALIKPPDATRADGELERPPLIRTIIFVVVGLIMSVWAVASLFS